MSRAVAAINGILVVYVIGFVNAMLALVVVFGVNLSTTQG